MDVTIKHEIERKILAKLEECGLDFYEQVFTGPNSKQNARMFREQHGAMGAKSILFKSKDEYFIFTLAFDREIDSQKVRKILGTNKLRFATIEELMEQCQVVKGALSPIVKDIYPIKHYIDRSIDDYDMLAFNAGVVWHTIVLSRVNLYKLIDAKKCEFSK